MALTATPGVLTDWHVLVAIIQPSPPHHTDTVYLSRLYLWMLNLMTISECRPGLQLNAELKCHLIPVAVSTFTVRNAKCFTIFCAHFYWHVAKIEWHCQTSKTTCTTFRYPYRNICTYIFRMLIIDATSQLLSAKLLLLAARLKGECRVHGSSGAVVGRGVSAFRHLGHTPG